MSSQSSCNHPVRRCRVQLLDNWGAARSHHCASHYDEYTAAAWLRTWYELYAKPNVRTATANRYQLIIEHDTIPRIGNIKLKKLTTRHLQKLYKELLESGRIHIGKNQDKGLSTTTVHSVHLMLHCALDRAVKERRHHSPAKWRGCKDGVLHAGAL